MGLRSLVLVALAMTPACTAIDHGGPAAHVETGDPAVLRLVEAATRAERALLALAHARDGGVTNVSPPRVVPEELLQKVSVDWIGPLETLAADMAERAGYRFSESGPPSVTPLMVTIHASGTPLVLVLRDAGLQAGDAARLVVDARNREIRVERARPGGDSV